jgi:hypothetical protein
MMCGICKGEQISRDCIWQVPVRYPARVWRHFFSHFSSLHRLLTSAIVGLPFQFYSPGCCLAEARERPVTIWQEDSWDEHKKSWPIAFENPVRGWNQSPKEFDYHLKWGKKGKRIKRAGYNNPIRPNFNVTHKSYRWIWATAKIKK